MAKKQNNTEKAKNDNPYKLNTEAVDRLVNADKKKFDDPRLDPGRKYRSSFIDRLPPWFKAIFMKFWFNGAVCFFIFWGLGIYLPDMLDMIVVMGVVLGIVTDIFVNNAFRFFALYEGQNDKWMMFPKKAYWTFITNILYSFVILLAVIWIYNAINGVLGVLTGREGEMFLGVEPILFGVFYMLVDLALIGIKNLSVTIVKDAIAKTENK